jgi:hypothetical protein
MPFSSNIAFPADELAITLFFTLNHLLLISKHSYLSICLNIV